MANFDPSSTAAIQLAVDIQELCLQRANQILASMGVDASGQRENQRVSALARLQAVEEVISTLRNSADFDLVVAVARKANYAEVGAACGISRQAARKRHLRILAERRRQSEEHRNRRSAKSLDFHPDEDDELWPPRSWRFRAPNGHHTVQLVGGPCDSQSLRVAVGDDAYPVAGYRKLHGNTFTCFARYAQSGASNSNYHFTGEYYLR